MTISIDEFINKYNGQSVDYDKKYGAQCVDLFNFYNKEVIGGERIGTPDTGGARDLFESDITTRGKYYKKLSIDEPLQRGDVQVYAAPQGRAIVDGQQIFYGHVNIYIGDGQVIQQNTKWNQLTTIDPNFSNGLIGILRPIKFIGENSPQDVTQQAPNKNKHVIKTGDTFWGLENVYNMEHGTLQKLNPELDPRRLAVGSEIVLSEQPTPKPSTTETYYTITKGDTFWGLEDAWGIEHGTLTGLNPGIEPRALQIGKSIRRS